MNTTSCPPPSGKKRRKFSQVKHDEGGTVASEGAPQVGRSKSITKKQRSKEGRSPSASPRPERGKKKTTRSRQQSSATAGISAVQPPPGPEKGRKRKTSRARKQRDASSKGGAVKDREHKTQDAQKPKPGRTPSLPAKRRRKAATATAETEEGHTIVGMEALRPSSTTSDGMQVSAWGPMEMDRRGVDAANKDDDEAEAERCDCLAARRRLSLQASRLPLPHSGSVDSAFGHVASMSSAASLSRRGSEDPLSVAGGASEIAAGEDDEQRLLSAQPLASSPHSISHSSVLFQALNAELQMGRRQGPPAQDAASPGKGVVGGGGGDAADETISRRAPRCGGRRLSFGSGASLIGTPTKDSIPPAGQAPHVLHSPTPPPRAQQGSGGLSRGAGSPQESPRPRPPLPESSTGPHSPAAESNDSGSGRRQRRRSSQRRPSQQQQQQQPKSSAGSRAFSSPGGGGSRSPRSQESPADRARHSPSRGGSSRRTSHIPELNKKHKRGSGSGSAAGNALRLRGSGNRILAMPNTLPERYGGSWNGEDVLQNTRRTAMMRALHQQAAGRHEEPSRRQVEELGLLRRPAPLQSYSPSLSAGANASASIGSAPSSARGLGSSAGAATVTPGSRLVPPLPQRGHGVPMVSKSSEGLWSSSSRPCCNGSSAAANSSRAPLLQENNYVPPPPSAINTRPVLLSSRNLFGESSPGLMHHLRRGRGEGGDAAGTQASFADLSDRPALPHIPEPRTPVDQFVQGIAALDACSTMETEDLSLPTSGRVTPQNGEPAVAHPSARAGGGQLHSSLQLSAASSSSSSSRSVCPSLVVTSPAKAGNSAREKAGREGGPSPSPSPAPAPAPTPRPDGRLLAQKVPEAGSRSQGKHRCSKEVLRKCRDPSSWMVDLAAEVAVPHGTSAPRHGAGLAAVAATTSARSSSRTSDRAAAAVQQGGAADKVAPPAPSTASTVLSVGVPITRRPNEEELEKQRTKATDPETEVKSGTADHTAAALKPHVHMDLKYTSPVAHRGSSDPGRSVGNDEDCSTKQHPSSRQDAEVATASTAGEEGEPEPTVQGTANHHGRANAPLPGSPTEKVAPVEVGDGRTNAKAMHESGVPSANTAAPSLGPSSVLPQDDAQIAGAASTFQHQKEPPQPSSSSAAESRTSGAVVPASSDAASAKDGTPTDRMVAPPSQPDGGSLLAAAPCVMADPVPLDDVVVYGPQRDSAGPFLRSDGVAQLHGTIPGHSGRGQHQPCSDRAHALTVEPTAMTLEREPLSAAVRTPETCPAQGPQYAPAARGGTNALLAHPVDAAAEQLSSEGQYPHGAHQNTRWTNDSAGGTVAGAGAQSGTPAMTHSTEDKGVLFPPITSHVTAAPPNLPPSSPRGSTTVSLLPLPAAAARPAAAPVHSSGSPLPTPLVSQRGLQGLPERPSGGDLTQAFHTHRSASPKLPHGQHGAPQEQQVWLPQTPLEPGDPLLATQQPEGLMNRSRGTMVEEQSTPTSREAPLGRVGERFVLYPNGTPRVGDGVEEGLGEELMPIRQTDSGRISVALLSSDSSCSSCDARDLDARSSSRFPSAGRSCSRSADSLTRAASPLPKEGGGNSTASAPRGRHHPWRGIPRLPLSLSPPRSGRCEDSATSSASDSGEGVGVEQRTPRLPLCSSTAYDPGKKEPLPLMLSSRPRRRHRRRHQHPGASASGSASPRPPSTTRTYTTVASSRPPSGELWIIGSARRHNNPEEGSGRQVICGTVFQPAPRPLRANQRGPMALASGGEVVEEVPKRAYNMVPVKEGSRCPSRLGRDLLKERPLSQDGQSLLLKPPIWCANPGGGGGDGDGGGSDESDDSSGWEEEYRGKSVQCVEQERRKGGSSDPSRPSASVPPMRCSQFSSSPKVLSGTRPQLLPPAHVRAD